ncbi:hypothetical protein O1611_g2231 [Lasiodiplodia mahajangana]|uniref:Uncharacterized protein n=1 Tax=Lasiodiplodia mahajangana TaxID=1108764 RepID=A0ACC2JVI0_9PEZI|nr:hypothetical protein O1611_g2231 [Lasiodiplodia mahajangana]
MAHSTMGEEHTPSRSLDNTGLLIYREGIDDSPELFLGYRLDDPSQTYSIPNLVPYLGETALETAIRVGRLSLGTTIPAELLDYNHSVVIDSPGTSVRVRVFIMRATREITTIPNHDGWRIRTHGPGDMGKIVSQHGSLYAREFGWTASFEASTARIVADFLDNHDPRLECVFVAESADTGKFLGSIACLKHREEADTALLRLFAVDPSARGMGLGARLIDDCVSFARDRGYAKIVLWTFSVLEGARRLYKRLGFQLVVVGEEKEYWGTRLVSECWELALSSAEGKAA